MNTQMFSFPEGTFKKAGIKLLLVLLGGLVTYLESFIPGFAQTVIVNPVALTIVLAINTGVVDALRKYLADEEGKLGGIKIN